MKLKETKKDKERLREIKGDKERLKDEIQSTESQVSQ